jgi:hypothetical protein
LTKKAINTSKIYSRNDTNVGFGPGCFLTTGDNVADKRYSNAVRQPKQSDYFDKKNRMNKTMVNALNKSGGPHKSDYIIPNTTSAPKRSGSGKVKKRNLYGKDGMVYDLGAVTKKPKSGRQISRNNKNVVIYTMAPVMTMTYKKKTKSFK